MEDSLSPDYREKFYLDCGFATRALHSGEHVGQPQETSHAGAIYQSSTFVFKSADEGAKIFAGERPGYIYTRMGNPTVMVLEAKMNALEGAEVKLRNPSLRVSTIAFSSGMAAISATVLALCRAGDTLLLGDVMYGATQHFADTVLTRFGIRTVNVDTANLDKVAEAVRNNASAKALLFETPTNPMLRVSDIAEVCRVAKSVRDDIKILVDNTFATPYLQNPLSLGADAVIHSTTKYLCGHGTVVGGVMTTICDDIKSGAYTMVKDVGSAPSPFDAWLVNLGMKTLPIRMERHCASAMAVAEYLEQHPKVEKVYYPGLESSPDHELAKRQMKRFGGMVSFEIAGGLAAGRKVMDKIHIFTLAVSLGCVDSLIQHPASMTHACVPKAQRERGGITDGLIRISVGLEEVEDLIQALDAALAQV
ncbi:MAG: PLP-dependent aspartate aminotransferase family protein [Planctomycetota bacterium]